MILTNKKSRDPGTSSKERREGQITTSEEETQLQGFAWILKGKIIRNVIQMGFMEENAKP